MIGTRVCYHDEQRGSSDVRRQTTFHDAEQVPEQCPGVTHSYPLLRGAHFP